MKDGKFGEPGDIHHLTETGKRDGNDATVCLCPWHHRGVPALGFSQNWMREKFGPSRAKSKKEFVARYGTDKELLAESDRLIGIASRKAGRSAA